MKSTTRLAAVVVLALASACRGGGEKPKPAGGLTIAVIPKGTSHEYWKSIHAGAVKAARELTAAGTPVQVVWKGPIREDDRDQQVQVVEGFLAGGVNGIVLAPLDEQALVRPVEEAQRAGVPSVIVDSPLKSTAIVSYVATDNFKGGELAADGLAKLLGGKGKIIALRYDESSASTRLREEGFLARMKSTYPGVQVVVSDQYAGVTRETAKRASENLLNRYAAEIQGVFTPNESSTVGMLLALQDNGLAGKMKFVGFDASQTLVDALRAGQLQAIVVQNPMDMGYLGVKTVVAYIRKQAVEKLVDTGVTLVTRENMDATAVAALLHPPIAQYLDAR